MSEVTNIEWTDATWNIARGCSKVDEDCKYCYMYRDSFDSKRYDPKVVKQTKTVFDMPLKWGKEKSDVWAGRPLIFTSSLTDVFHPAIDSFRDQMWEIIRRCPMYIFQILTKRPERIKDNLPKDWGDGWDNVWLGTSIGSQKGMDRLWPLLEVPTVCRFVSFEPLHERVDMNIDLTDLMKIHWAIIGGETGNESGKYRYRPCELSWIRELKSDLTSTTAVFIKQMGTHLSKELGITRHGKDISEFPKDLQVRQMPDWLI